MPPIFTTLIDHTDQGVATLTTRTARALATRLAAVLPVRHTVTVTPADWEGVDADGPCVTVETGDGLARYTVAELTLPAIDQGRTAVISTYPTGRNGRVTCSTREALTSAAAATTLALLAP